MIARFCGLAAGLGFLVWFGVLWWLSSRSNFDLEPPKIPHFDKIAHFGYFGLGAILLFSALRFSAALRGWHCAVIVVVLLGVVGVVDEWHQTHTPGRQGADKGDWIADISGASLASLFLLYGYGRVPRVGRISASKATD